MLMVGGNLILTQEQGHLGIGSVTLLCCDTLLSDQEKIAFKSIWRIFISNVYVVIKLYRKVETWKSLLEVKLET